MGGQPLRLGPFVGGLNTASDPTAIADAELAKATNFELDIDGSLISRCALAEVDGHTSWTERIICICEAIFSGTYYLIGSNSTGVYYRQSGAGQAWTLITNTFQSMAAVQYAGSVYIVAIPGSANPGGKWNPGGGFTAVAAMPKGQACTIHKERLYVAPGILATSNASRLIFSNAGNFDTWTGTDFIDIKQGDGTNLVDLTVFQDNLLLFKDKSSHVLAYDTRPSDAVVREISKTIGVSKQFNMVNYENQVYIFSSGWVYEIINYDFNRLNTKVPFVVDDTAPSAFTAENIFLSLVGDRLICRFHRNIYVYGLRTRTWSQWESVRSILHYFGPVVTLHPPTGNEFYAGSCLSANRTTIQLFDLRATSTKEQTLDPIQRIKAVDTFTRSASNGWGTSDSGHVWTTSGGAAADYSVNGTKGVISLTSVNVARGLSLAFTAIANQDIVYDVEASAIALTQTIVAESRFRFVDNNNFYGAQVIFETTGLVTLGLYKIVAGVVTGLGVPANLGSYIANDQFTIRLQANGTAIKVKGWKSTLLEPVFFQINVTDAGVTAAGTFTLHNYLTTGNTNVLPVTIRYDDVNIGDPNDNISAITCACRTKNFDMAISHQFKRLWWWGVDVSTANLVTGIATPIVVSFTSTWGDLAAYTWGQLATWGQPLTTISSVVTTQTTATGTARRFIKFNKGLRYRQINFEVDLTTDGSTVDGPARLFTMTILTESRETVPKGVN
jgi:hypothetical protein